MAKKKTVKKNVKNSKGNKSTPKQLNRNIRIFIIILSFIVLGAISIFIQQTTAKPHLVQVQELRDPALIKVVTTIENCFYLQNAAALNEACGKSPTTEVITSFKTVIDDYTATIGYLKKADLDKHFSQVRYQNKRGTKTIYISFNKNNTATYWFDIQRQNDIYIIIAVGYCWQ